MNPHRIADLGRTRGTRASASSDLMAVLARACGHDHLEKFCADDLTTFDREMAHLTGISYGGVRL